MTTGTDFDEGKWQGTVTGKLESLELGQKSLQSSLDDFKSGIGRRVEDTEKITQALTGKVDLLLWILAKISTPILAIIGAGIAGSAVWQIMKK